MISADSTRDKNLKSLEKANLLDKILAAYHIWTPLRKFYFFSHIALCQTKIIILANTLLVQGFRNSEFWIKNAIELVIQNKWWAGKVSPSKENEDKRPKRRKTEDAKDRRGRKPIINWRGEPKINWKMRLEQIMCWHRIDENDKPEPILWNEWKLTSPRWI